MKDNKEGAILGLKELGSRGGINFNEKDWIKEKERVREGTIGQKVGTRVRFTNS